ncbi:MAG: hypothetical protein ACQGVK_12695 [Myxococcota bacterium]
MDAEPRSDRCSREPRAERRRAPGARTRWLLLGLLAATIALPGCITRTVDTRIKDTNTIRVFLRKQVRNGKPIERDFAHPKTIAAERLAHILALIDIKTGDAAVEERRSAIATSLLEPIATALSEALAQADSTQQIGVMAIERKRRLGVFTRKFLTTFIAFAKGDDLFLDFTRIEWEIPKNREDRLPKPELGSQVMEFQVAGSVHMQRTTRQTLAVDWSNPLFARPLGMQSDRGEVRRRTVLMETPGLPADASDDPGDMPAGLTPEALRALADLEEARRQGEITESEYDDLREALLAPYR